MYEYNTLWRKRAYCWYTTHKTAESEEEEIQEESGLIEKGSYTTGKSL